MGARLGLGEIIARDLSRNFGALGIFGTATKQNRSDPLAPVKRTADERDDNTTRDLLQLPPMLRRHALAGLKVLTNGLLDLLQCALSAINQWRVVS